MSREAVVSLAKSHFCSCIFLAFQGINENVSLEKEITKQQGMLNKTLGWEPGVLGSSLALGFGQIPFSLEPPFLHLK